MALGVEVRPELAGRPAAVGLRLGGRWFWWSLLLWGKRMWWMRWRLGLGYGMTWWECRLRWWGGS